MSISSFIEKFKRFTFNKITTKALKEIRVFKYKFLSDCKQVSGKPVFVSPALINGLGSVVFGTNVSLGVYGSPGFFSTYIFIEARTINSKIKIGSNVFINNNACLISEGCGIVIGDDVLIGPNFSVFDTDFHEIHPQKRHSGEHESKMVRIEKNVFIGANVTILKGVCIGENSVIGSGSVVVKTIPKNVIAGGNPCKVIKEI